MSTSRLIKAGPTAQPPHGQAAQKRLQPQTRRGTQPHCPTGSPEHSGSLHPPQRRGQASIEWTRSLKAPTAATPSVPTSPKARRSPFERTVHINVLRLTVQLDPYLARRAAFYGPARPWENCLTGSHPRDHVPAAPAARCVLRSSSTRMDPTDPIWVPRYYILLQGTTGQEHSYPLIINLQRHPPTEGMLTTSDERGGTQGLYRTSGHLAAARRAPEFL